ncbi:MAG TPA: DinB family protein [Candidatus Sulfotelmatobacter sp.]|nr:DinB family protein [Candidatus Sulfotelmatobacter sp.]
MGEAAELASEYDAMMERVIALAESCSDEDWGVMCPAEQRTVGVLFDHIAHGNPQVVEWVGEFLGGRPVAITRESLDASNAAHAREAAARPRERTIEHLKSGSLKTSEMIRHLSDEELHRTQEFGWAGEREVAWVTGAAFRHPRGHLESIKAALNR